MNKQKLSYDLFLEIYTSNYPEIFNFVYKMTGNKNDAEDISQETFIQVYKNYNNFLGNSKLYTWIYTIAKNICYRYFQKTLKSSFLSFEILIESNSKNPESDQYEYFEKKSYINHVKEGCLLGLLCCLPFNQRISFILNIFAEITVKDIALIINKSENSIRILIHRARNSLKKFLCNNCSLFDNKNICKCENFIAFSLKQNWIEKYNPAKHPENIEIEIKEFKNEILLYKTLQNHEISDDLNKKITEIIKKEKYFVLS